MKIQNLAVIFIIIILPISIIVSAYTQNQITTLRLQMSYDNKLDTATYDAVKAFQLNTVNSSSSNYANSKMRDIEASVNTFYNSVATNFNMVGYNSDVLKEYVPALVYTMYDGYYIYSPYINTLDAETDDSLKRANPSDINYKNGEKISGLKPYIYYSCRYQKDDIDVVITYALDNYVTIQGTIRNGGEIVNKSGYILDGIQERDSDTITYKEVEFGKNENLQKEWVGNKEYEYIKINGVKYYKDTEDDRTPKRDKNNQIVWFSIFNGKRLTQDSLGNLTKNKSAYEFYKEALELKKFITDKGIDNLTAKDAVINGTTDDNEAFQIKDENGNIIYDFKAEGGKIFDYSDGKNGKSIENPDSDFNQHRLAVIRYTIEKNLSIAIANYNNYSGVNANFQMPRLKEDEWEKILNNISVISFLQGLNIGGKLYNGYSIITNNKNEELVTNDAIYMVTEDGYYHRVTDANLRTDEIIDGIFNVDVERKEIDGKTGRYSDDENEVRYYYPRKYLACYNCIVNQTNINNTDNIYEYIDNSENKNLKKIYYTSLARERYSMYKVIRNPISFKNGFKAGD